MNWKVGDVVQLKSGGPAMTVTYYGPGFSRDTIVTCQWFVNNEQKSGDFPPEALKAYEGSSTTNGAV